MRIRIAKRPESVHASTAQEYSGFAFNRLPSFMCRLEMKHTTGTQVWLDMSRGEAEMLAKRIIEVLGKTKADMKFCIQELGKVITEYEADDSPVEHSLKRVSDSDQCSGSECTKLTCVLCSCGKRVCKLHASEHLQ